MNPEWRPSIDVVLRSLAVTQRVTAVTNREASGHISAVVHRAIDPASTIVIAPKSACFNGQDDGQGSIRGIRELAESHRELPAELRPSVSRHQRHKPSDLSRHCSTIHNMEEQAPLRREASPDMVIRPCPPPMTVSAAR